MNARDYVGIPFLERGRTRDGCDCWGLVRLVLHDEFGVDVPLFDGYSNLKSMRHIGQMCDEGKPLVAAARVDAPDPGIVVVMLVGPHPAHLGICVDDQHLLHVEKGCNAVYQRIDQVRHRIEGFYKVGGMA